MMPAMEEMRAKKLYFSPLMLVPNDFLLKSGEGSWGMRVGNNFTVDIPDTHYLSYVKLVAK